MKQLTRSVVLCVPANVAYSSWKEVDTTRYTCDLTKDVKLEFFKDIPNSKLAAKKRNSRGKSSMWEWNFKPLSRKSCEVTMKVDYGDRNDKRMKAHFASYMRILLTLEYGYRVGLVEHIREI